MILIFEFGLILLWVLTGNAKVQLAQYFEVNNLKKIKEKSRLMNSNSKKNEDDLQAKKLKHSLYQIL